MLVSDPGASFWLYMYIPAKGVCAGVRVCLYYGQPIALS